MKKLTQRQVLYRQLESTGQWTRAYDLRGKQTAFGFSGHQADRRLRELAAEGKIEHRVFGGYAEYRVVRKPYLEELKLENVSMESKFFAEDEKQIPLFNA